MPPADSPSVVAVVVAYNRRHLLLEVLDALAAQTLAPTRVIVVDNASDDGSGRAAAEHPSGVDLVTLERNTGGAGGFAAGAAHALQSTDADWLWFMDDDTVPTPSALAELLAAAADDERVVLAGSRVIWTDGTDHPMNTPRRKPLVRRAERHDAEARGLLPVRSSSFVSMLVRASAVRERGLPIADYFIWNDDFEFSTRLLRGRRGVFVPASVVAHKTAKLGATDVDPGPRFYYEVRNKLWMLRFSRGLNPAEKALYGGSSVLRWARTVLRSGDRATLRDGFWRGWRHGWRSAPRDNARALADLGTASTEVAAFERRRAGGAGGRA
jgi:Predicted glycosyltransferases